MYQVIDRGRVWDVQVLHIPWRRLCTVQVLLLPEGDRVTWKSADKRLASLARYLAPSPRLSDDAFLALVSSCLNPGQRAWLTRWLRDDSRR